MFRKKKTWGTWLDDWQPIKAEISLPFLKLAFDPKKGDRQATWEMHVEMLTRIVTQPLAEDSGDEKAALDSVYSLFATTRTIMKAYGVEAKEFTKLALIVLNVIVRPFTAKWHKLSISGSFDDPQMCKKFRSELSELQAELIIYNEKLADMAGAGEGLTKLQSYN